MIRIINATAALKDPYDDNLGLPFNKGLNYIDESRMTNLITTLEQTGYDFHIHALGDRGISESINAIEAARATNGDIGARHRITHLEIVDQADYDRFAALDIIADMQVAGDFTQPESWGENDFLIGSARSANLIPLKSLFEAGAKITLSSDWDVSSLNPFVGMQNALTRAPQNLSNVEDVVKAYTINGAYTMRQETTTGSIEVGKFADFICVDQDIFTVPTTQIAQTLVLSTHLNGLEIFRSSALSIEDDLKEFNHDLADTFSIFPNPTQERLRINLADLAADSISIYAVDGRLLDTIQIENDNLLEVDLSGFPNGLLLIKVSLKNGRSVSSKFIKM